MLKSIMAFFKEEKGLTAVEYAVAGGLVIASLVAAFTTLGGSVEARLEQLTTAIGGTPT